MSQYNQPGASEYFWSGLAYQQGYAGPEPTKHWWPKLSEEAVCGAPIMVRVNGAFQGSTGQRATTELDHVNCVKCLRHLAAIALKGPDAA